MSTATPGKAVIAGYHAHIYFDVSNREYAADIREVIGKRFDVEMGRWRDVPVGPHPRSMYQVAFTPDVFADFVPWLMVNHGDLSVLIHPRTGDDLSDHRDYPLWLGEKLDLDLSVL